MADYPAMPLWTDAYLADTRHLSTLEHGAYLLLMMEAWRRPDCSLPDDDRLLSRLAGLAQDDWLEIKGIVMDLWAFDGRSKKWTQKRLSKERNYVANKSRIQRDKALSRWKGAKKSDATAKPKRCPDDAPTPTPTPTSPHTPPEGGSDLFSEGASKPKSKPKKPDLVAILSEVLPEAKAAEFVEHRKQIRKPMTELAAKQAVAKLKTFPDPVESVNHSILSGWPGVYPREPDRRQPASSSSGSTILRRVQSEYGGRE